MDEINPDCRAGKHQACSGDAWDTKLDEPTSCRCLCHGEGLTSAHRALTAVQRAYIVEGV